jgi:CubicO group peptidase (beta-lactamase class C family)
MAPHYFGLLLVAATVAAVDFDGFIQSELAQNYSHVPGIAVVIVQNGSVVLEKGYGVTKLGEPTAVDSKSLFQVGSLSKTLISIGLAVLVDEGKLKWHDKVKTNLPELKLADDYATQNLQLADLLTHRIGLAEGQGDFLMSLFHEAEAVHHAAYIKPAFSFREKFNYNNMGWQIAGQVLSQAVGEHWCDFLTRRVFLPLNMSRTFCSIEDVPVEHQASISAVHYLDPCSSGSTAPVSVFKISTNATHNASWPHRLASGSMVSCVHDFGKLLELLLQPAGEGAAAIGVTAQTLQTMQAGQMIAEPDWATGGGLPWAPTPARAVMVGYGLDLTGDLFQGERYFDKSGDTGLHKARMGALPARRSGVFILGNLGGSVGGELTALKFGLVALLTGRDAKAASAQVSQSLDLTGYLKVLPTLLECNQCGRRNGSDPLCAPAGLAGAPLGEEAYQGVYSNEFAGQIRIALGQGQGRGQNLHIWFGPMGGLPLSFDRTSAFVNTSCAGLASTLQSKLPPWSPLASGIAQLDGWCTLTQFVVQPEVPMVGTSVTAQLTSFPWGAGLPDPYQAWFISHRGQVQRVLWADCLDAPFDRLP